MLALFIYEITEWYKKSYKASFLLFAAAISILTAATFLRPEIFFPVLILLIFIITSFAFYKSGIEKKKLNQSDIKINKIKLFLVRKSALIFILFLYILFIFPFMIFTTILWGLSISEFIKLLIVLLSAEITTGNIVSFSLKLKTENKILFIIYFLIAVNILPILIPNVKIITPLYISDQILKSSHDNFILYLMLFIFINLIFNFFEYIKTDYEE